jgi:transposase-like protein
MTLNLKSKIYTDETAAREYLESVQWPNGPICPHCGVLNEATALQGASTRPGVYKCRPCQKPFSVTVGTVFERSKISLTKWLLATELLTASKKGISSHQLARMLDVTYKTAWFMSMRIREAMTPKDAGRMGGEGMVVEADETELSPSRKSRPRARAKNLKFVSLVERGGKVRSRKLTGAEGPVGMQVHKVLYRNLHPESVPHTDGAPHYTLALAAASHEAVNHNKEFARTAEDGSRVHTNSAEGFFSIFKRGLVGTYQHMSEQHLHSYLAEFDFRMSNRAKLGIDDDMRCERALKGIQGKRLMYRRPDAA